MNKKLSPYFISLTQAKNVILAVTTKGSRVQISFLHLLADASKIVCRNFAPCQVCQGGFV